MSTWINQARTRVPRVAEAAVERARLTVVPRSAPHRATRVPFVTLVSLLLVGGVAGLLFFNTSMQQTSFHATRMQDRATALAAEQQGLQLQMDALRDPQRLAARAKRLGMVPPASPAFLRLSDGHVLGAAIPASAADAIRINPLPTARPRDLNPPPIVVHLKPGTTGTRNRHAGGAAAPTTGAVTSTKKSH